MFKLFARLFRRNRPAQPPLRIERTADRNIYLVNGVRVRTVSRETALMIVRP